MEAALEIKPTEKAPPVSSVQTPALKLQPKPEDPESGLFGLKVSDRTTRKPEQVERIKRDITRIAKAFSNNHHIEVLPSNSDHWSCTVPPEGRQIIDDYLSGKRDTLNDVPFFALRPRQVFYPIKDLESRPEGEIVALLRHHVARASKSDQGCFFEGQRIAEKQGFLPSTWMTVHDALESCWVDNRLIQESGTTKSQIMGLYKNSATEIEREIEALPAPLQLARQIRYYWLTGKSVPGLEISDAGRSFATVKKEIDSYLNGTSSQANFALLRDSIWPHVRELEHSAAKAQAMVQLGRDMASGNATLESKAPPPAPVATTSPAPIPAPTLPIFDAEPLTKKRSIWLTSVSELFGWQKVKKIFRRLNGRHDQKTIIDHPKATASEAPLPKSEISLAALKQENQQKLEQAYTALSTDDKKQLESQARANLERAQSAHLAREGNSFLLEKDPATGTYSHAQALNVSDEQVERLRKAITLFEAELKRRNEEVRPPPEDTGVRLRQLQDQILKQEMRRNGFAENEQGFFTEFLAMENTLRGHIKRFVSDFADLLPRGRALKHTRGFESGSRLNFDKLIDEVHSPGKGDVFERRTITPSDAHEISIWVIVDHSPSMKENGKITESTKALVFWARVLRDLDIPLSIKFFAGDVTEVLRMNEDYDDPRNKAKAKLMREANNFPGWTNIGQPLELVLAEARALPRTEYGKRRAGAVFVISDSGANQGKQGPALRELIAGMQKELLVQNFLLNGDKNEIEQAKLYFGESNIVVADRFEHFPMIAIERLRKVLYQFSKQIVRNGE